MRRLFFILLWVPLLAGAAPAEPAPAATASPELEGLPAPLATALHKLMVDEDHWAYTQTTQVFDRAGQPEEGPQVERYDPSQPEDAQWTLLQRKGRPPTDREVRVWKRKKEKELRRREEKSLGEVLDFARASVHREEAPAVVYEVPLKKSASRRFPAEKFVAYLTVNRDRLQLERFGLRAREAFRMVGVAKVDKVEIDAQFATVDPQYPPQPHLIQASGAGRVLFFRVGASAEIKWSDFKRVTPYNDRFVVELGELKVLDF
jgi:hypothetical protein